MNYTVIVAIAVVVLGGATYLFMNQSDLNPQAGEAEVTQVQVQSNSDEEEVTSEAELATQPATEEAQPKDEPVLEVATEGDVSIVDDEPEAKVFNITGWNFAYSMEEIRVQEGDTVTINLESSDGYHDWAVDAFKAYTERVNTGDTTSVTFVADKAGTYEFYCSVGSHRAQGMVGTLIVE